MTQSIRPPLPSIKFLRQNGFKVRVTHERKQERVMLEIGTDIDNDPIFVLKHRLAARGGSTKIEVRTPEGKEYSATTNCSDSENYCRADGVTEAMYKLPAEVFNFKSNYYYPPIDKIERKKLVETALRCGFKSGFNFSQYPHENKYEDSQAENDSICINLASKEIVHGSTDFYRNRSEYKLVDALRIAQLIESFNNTNTK